MKRLLYFAVAVMAVLSTTGCEKEKTKSASLIGTWQIDRFESITYFRKDGQWVKKNTDKIWFDPEIGVIIFDEDGTAASFVGKDYGHLELIVDGPITVTGNEISGAGMTVKIDALTADRLVLFLELERTEDDGKGNVTQILEEEKIYCVRRQSGEILLPIPGPKPEEMIQAMWECVSDETLKKDGEVQKRVVKPNTEFMEFDGREQIFYSVKENGVDLSCNAYLLRDNLIINRFQNERMVVEYTLTYNQLQVLIRIGENVREIVYVRSDQTFDRNDIKKALIGEFDYTRAQTFPLKKYNGHWTYSGNTVEEHDPVTMKYRFDKNGKGSAGIYLNDTWNWTPFTWSVNGFNLKLKNEQKTIEARIHSLTDKAIMLDEEPQASDENPQLIRHLWVRKAAK